VKGGVYPECLRSYLGQTTDRGASFFQGRVEYHAFVPLRAGERMPPFQLPASAKLQVGAYVTSPSLLEDLEIMTHPDHFQQRMQGKSIVRGELCEHWVVEDMPSRVHVFLGAGSPPSTCPVHGSALL
jgi:hypothetical protein